MFLYMTLCIVSDLLNSDLKTRKYVKRKYGLGEGPGV